MEKIRFRDLVVEMKVSGPRPDEEYTIVAYRDKIWTFYDASDDTWERNIEEIEEHLTEITGDDVTLDVDNTYHIGSEISDHTADMLVARVSGDTMRLSGAFDDSFDPQSSLLIQKVFKELGLKTLVVETMEDEEMYFDFQVEAKVPDFAYHGTTTTHLMRILKLGLRPNQANSNWEAMGITHRDKLFFTTKASLAMFHSYNASQHAEGLPMVIRFMIPDKEKIIPDYDVETEANPATTKQRHYDELRHVQDQAHSNSKSSYSAERLTKEKGIYGYTGSIMPKFIKEIYILTENPDEPSEKLSDYHNFDKDYIVKRIKEYGEYFDLDEPESFQELLLADEWDLDQMVNDREGFDDDDDDDEDVEKVRFSDVYNESVDPNYVCVYHGGAKFHRIDAKLPNPRKGKFESGIGINTTTHYNTARKYAKGGKIVSMLCLTKNMNLASDVEVPVEEFESFAKTHLYPRYRKPMIEDVKSNAERMNTDSVKANIIINLSVNYQIGGNNGLKLIKFLVDMGVDASLYSQSNDEDWLIIHDTSIIEDIRHTKPSDIQRDEYELPNIKEQLQ